MKRDIIYLNVNQRAAFDVLCQAITSDEKDFFFLEDFDDIDKIFLINLMLVKIHFENCIALSIIFSGIVTTLLNDDIITHSRFKISIDIQSNSTCNIPAQSNLANLLRETDLMFWNETSI